MFQKYLKRLEIFQMCKRLGKSLKVFGNVYKDSDIFETSFKILMYGDLQEIFDRIYSKNLNFFVKCRKNP